MSDKIRLLPQREADEAVAAVEALKRELPTLMEHAKSIAKLRRAAYLAHIDEGFTPQEALVLCQQMSI